MTPRREPQSDNATRRMTLLIVPPRMRYKELLYLMCHLTSFQNAARSPKFFVCFQHQPHLTALLLITFFLSRYMFPLTASLFY